MKGQLQILKGDITQLPVDAVVNATNPSLLGSGGTEGALHQAAGPELLTECKNLGGCAVGHAKLSPGFNLPAKYIIHTVGPVWRGGAKGEMPLLCACYTACLKLALSHQIKTLAFPAISCGIYGYPVTQAATIALKETANFLELHPEISSVTFVCDDDDTYNAYQHALDAIYQDAYHEY